MRFVTSVFILITAAQTALGWNCWLPDGIAFDNKGMVPCNLTLADTPTGSSCCDPKDSCSTSGLCLGASGSNYRGGCTAQDWKSPSCAAECRTDPVLKIPYSRAGFLWNCGTGGLFSDQFCCGTYADPVRSCCASAFRFTGSGLAFKPGRDLEIQQLSSATASPTPRLANQTASAPSPTNPTSQIEGDKNGTNLGLAIGAGVGVPLGVLALGILGFLFWREKKRANTPPSPPAKESSVGVYHGSYVSGGGEPEWNAAPVDTQWLPQQQQSTSPPVKISQLDENRVHELDNSTRR